MSIATELADLPHPRLLFARLDNTGDVVLLDPAVRAAREAIPGCAVTLWTTKAGAQAAPLLEGVEDVIVSRPIWQEVGSVSFDPGGDRRLILELRRRRFDAAFIFTSFSQTPHPAALLCSLAGIPRRAGSSDQRAGGGLLFEAAPPPFEQHQADRALNLLEAAGFAVADRSLRLHIPEWRPDGGLPRRYVVVSPWASCTARSYPAERMLDAARMIAAARGWPIYLVGRESEKSRATALLASSRAPGVAGAGPSLSGGHPRPTRPSDVIDLVGSTTVPQLAALIARADVVFCNNSLALHLADGARTPVIVTYAGTDRDSQWAPRDAPHRLLRRPTRCAPCFLMTCPNRHACLDIPAAEVAAEAEGLLV